MYREENAEPNSVYDAWLLINQTTRREFDLDLFLERYPGMKATLEHINNEEEDNPDGPNAVDPEQCGEHL